MRREALAVVSMVMLAFSAASRASPASPAFTGRDPLFQWSVWAEAPLLCFEGGAVNEGAWTLPALPPDSGLEAALSSLGRTDYPVRFRTVQMGTRQVVIADQVRGADGSFTHVPALLDTPVRLERRVRGTNDALEALLEALHVATGATVLSGLFLNGEQVTEAGGVGVPARDVLAEILDAQTADDPPDKGTWLLVWDGAEQRWVLNIRFLHGPDKHWGPPPARPVPAEPPHRP